MIGSSVSKLSQLIALGGRHRFLWDGVLLGLLISIGLGVTTLYVSSEQTFYWWDYAGYNTATVSIADSFQKAPDRAVQQVIDSLSKEKNLLISLPLVPFIQVFGNSRLAYILSVSLLYGLPFRLLLGAIATRLIPARPRPVFWSTVFLSLLIPMSWIPTLRGYLDTGGCLFIALGILIYLSDIQLKAWWKIPLMGSLLAVSILLRRHFAYSVAAFLGAICLQVFLSFGFAIATPTLRDKAMPNLLKMSLRISLIVATCVTLLLLIARDFTQSAITVDYRELYTAWSLSLPDILDRYASFYGLGTCLLIVLGFSAGFLTHTLLPIPGIFVVLFGSLSVIEWLFILRYGYLHYTLHLTPIFGLGLASFLWSAWLKLPRKTSYIMVGLTGSYLLLNLALGLTPFGKINPIGGHLFAASFPPLVRSDYQEVLKLVNFLRTIAPNEEPIILAGASNELNANILRQANKVLNPPEGWWKLNILGRPQIDSRDTYPLPELLQAQYAIVATPFQQVLPTDEQVLRSGEQDVVKVLYDAFTQNWEIAQDFRRLPEQFQLQGNITVTIYQRIRPTSVPVLVRTLYAMQQQIGDRPGTQLDWMSLRQSVYTSVDLSVRRETDRVYKVVTQSLKNSPTLDTSFLYLGIQPETAKLTGRIEFHHPQCQGVSLRFTQWDRQGHLTNLVEKTYTPVSFPELDLSLPKKNSIYLLLEVLTPDRNEIDRTCKLAIDRLTLSPIKR